MSRYKVCSPWSVDPTVRGGEYDDDKGIHVVEVENADAQDTKTGDVYREGAFRVTVDGKPVRGKGGSTPFYGEMAWSDAQRLAYDLVVGRPRLCAR